jgi:IS30 family transposase
MRAWGMSAARQEELWTRWRAGEAVRAIARPLNKALPQVWHFLAQSGGQRPEPRRRAAGALTPAEREEISRGLAAGESSHAVANRLGRVPSTVSREVARNGGRAHYRATTAAAAAWRRAKRPKPACLAAHPRLRAVVEAKLARRWSPEQVARWLRREYPDDPTMRVSHETISLSLYVRGRGALRRELTRHLRRRRRMRTPPGAGGSRVRAGPMRDLGPIRARPAEVADRAVPGHWEGDLLCGRGMSAVGTLVERTSRHVLLFPVPSGALGATAAEVRGALAAAIARLPAALRRSLTWDRGRETAGARWRSPCASPSTPASRCTVVTRGARGSAARTRTPTACCASTSRAAPTCSR